MNKFLMTNPSPAPISAILAGQAPYCQGDQVHIDMAMVPHIETIILAAGRYIVTEWKLTPEYPHGIYSCHEIGTPYLGRMWVGGTLESFLAWIKIPELQQAYHPAKEA